MKTPAPLVTRRVIATLCLLAGIATSASSQGVTLQYRWNKGEEIRYRFTQETTTAVTGLPGGLGTVDVHVTLSQVLRTTVDDLTADGTATLTYMYESARFETETPMGTMSYDTEAKDAPGGAVPVSLKDVLSAVIGESFVVVMTRQGLVQKVEGMDRVMDKMLSRIPSNPSVTQMMQSLKASFSDESLRALFGQSHSIFPDRPLRTGESWQNQSTVANPMTGGQTVTAVFTLQAIEGSANAQVARVAVGMTIKPDQGAGAGPLAAMGLKMQPGDSSGEGELLFDAARGRLNRSSIRTTTPMEISLPAPDGSTTNVTSIVKSAFSAELLLARAR